ncbi:MAG TPA: BamA/TamA family outer membrane protein [Trichormus sp. M33_DOE_039]|nr:BamA/TamA family outer membrane protein [Trichormus sp. M33_DOE_039]
MRLSPVLVAAVAITAPLTSSLSANAQTPNSLEQTAEVSPPATNQQSEQVETSPEQQSQFTEVKSLAETPTLETPAPAASSSVNKSTNSATTATKEVTVPTVEVATIANPPTQQFNSFPDIQASAAVTKNSTPQKSVAKSPVVISSSLSKITTTKAALSNRGTASQLTQVPATNPTTPTPETTPTTPTTEPTTPTLETTPTTPTTEPTTPDSTNPPPTQDNFNTPNNTQETTEPRVLVSEVLVRAQTGQLTPELETQVYNVIRTQPGRTTTRTQLQEDINAIFATGFFSNVQAAPEDTPLGVRVSFVVQPNPVLTKVEIQANPGTQIASVLPSGTADEIFREQYGKILNLRDLQEGIKQLTKQYQDRGYVLANVIGAPQVSESGVVTLQVAEGVVENIKVRFRNKEGQDVNEKGEPIRGRTREYVIKRELELKPGQVFNRNTVQKDLQRVFGTGLFEDVNVSLDPGTDPSKVDVVVNVVERSSGSIAAGAGISSASGLFGTISYQQQNLGGRNQKLGAELQVGERELLFDLRFTDPWIAGDPYRTSYTANIFRRRSISLIFDGEDNDIRTFNPGNPADTDEQDRPRVTRLGGGLTFTRPLSGNPYERAEWTASAGFQYQRVTTRDSDGNLRKDGAVFDDNGNRLSETIPLSFSGTGEDDLLLLQLGAQRDRRDNPLQPTRGSFLRFGVDQSVPIGSGSIFLTRFRGSYSQYLPVKFTGFTRGPETLAFNIQGGTVFGDLPPYEAFTLGGSNSVRGYEEGTLSSGRSYVQASVEYRFPVFSVVSGALFFDVGSDLGTTTRAAEILNKNGTGYGYGLGVRVQSPLGPIRIDYGINDDGESRINFGIGERF